jgi:putative transposase
MRKLNQRKVRWIIREMEKGEMSVYSIAKLQGITPRWARELYKCFQETGNYPYPKRPGRPPRPISENDRTRVLAMKERHPISGALTLEKLLDREGDHIPHNRIHKILREEGLAKNEPKKQKRRKWVRYQRKHSNSLWHTDWFETEDGEHILPLEDDASRFITGFGTFTREAAKNGVLVLEKAIKAYGGPKQTMTDHGTPFTSLERKTCKDPKPNAFQKCLASHDIRHIKARVKHPQSNGKVEKLGDTLFKLQKHYDSWEEVIEYYNYERPHWSLKTEECETPFKAYIRKMWPQARVKFVKEHYKEVAKYAPEYLKLLEGSNK